MPSGSVLDLVSKTRIGALPAYLAGVNSNEISLQLWKPLLTRWWHFNVCAMKVMGSYKAWVELFEHLHESQQGDRLRLISHNGVAIGKSKNLKCDGELFCAFIHA